jgi:hypothetical protein
MMHIKQLWSESGWYRLALVLAGLFAALHLLLSSVYIGGPLIETGEIVAVDLTVYLDAARKVQSREPLYQTVSELQEMDYHFLYSPAFALGISWLLFLPPVLVAAIWGCLHLLAYVGLYISWQRIFTYLGFGQAVKAQALTLPLWLLFYSFWADLNWLNIHVFIALGVTLLLDAMLRKRLWLCVLWAVFLAISKPQWCVVMLVPLALGERRFFAKMAGLSAAAYLVVFAATSFALGSVYTVGQYQAYLHFLIVTMHESWPWRTVSEFAVLGTNHSPAQVILYFLGVNSTAWTIVVIAKLLVLSPLVVVLVKSVFRPLGRSHALDLAFALILGCVYIWLDVTWADTFLLGIVMFGYLVAVVRRRWVRGVLWGLFSLYALSEVSYVIGYLVLGDNVFLGDPQLPLFVTDPGAYIPLLTVIVLLFYTIFVMRLPPPGAAVPQNRSDNSGG